MLCWFSLSNFHKSPPRFKKVSKVCSQNLIKKNNVVSMPVFIGKVNLFFLVCNPQKLSLHSPKNHNSKWRYGVCVLFFCASLFLCSSAVPLSPSKWGRTGIENLKLLGRPLVRRPGLCCSNLFRSCRIPKLTGPIVRRSITVAAMPLLTQRFPSPGIGLISVTATRLQLRVT